MPKPKLPEEDKKEVVPLRLPKEAVDAVHDLARDWGEKRNKEIKPATVARELVLIGLDVIAAARQSKMLADLLREGAASDGLSKIRQMIDQSFSLEEVAREVVKILKANQPDPLPISKPPLTPAAELMDEQFSTEPFPLRLPLIHKKGGSK